jgi:hypothetical protein
VPSAKLALWILRFSLFSFFVYLGYPCFVMVSLKQHSTACSGRKKGRKCPGSWCRASGRACTADQFAPALVRGRVRGAECEARTLRSSFFTLFHSSFWFHSLPMFHVGQLTGDFCCLFRPQNRQKLPRQLVQSIWTSLHSGSVRASAG